MIETVVTFIYISYSLSGIYNRIGDSITVNAIGVCICLICLITVSGGITGACLNPYFGLVQTIYQRYLINKYPSMYSKELPGYGSMTVYILGTTVGGFLAGFF